MNGHRASERRARQLQPGAVAQRQHGFIKDAAHDVDALAEITQNLPGVFRRVLEGDNLEFDIRAGFVHLRPELHENLRGGHGRRADADDVGILQHGVFRARHRIPAVLNDVFCVLIQAASGFGQRKPAMRAVKELHAQRFLQQVDLLDNGGRRDIRFLGGAAEAARIGDAQKCFKLGIVHGGSRSFSLFLFILYLRHGLLASISGKIL